MTTPENQASPSPKPACVRIYVTPPLDFEDRPEPPLFAPKSAFMRALLPYILNWPVICVFVSTAFLTVCYVLGDFRHRKFDETWNPAMNPEHWFEKAKTQAKPALFTPVQAAAVKIEPKHNTK